MKDDREFGVKDEGKTPLDGNTEEVLAYADNHPDEVDALIEAEKDEAARKGVLEGLGSRAAEKVEWVRDEKTHKIVRK